ncbi:MaoC family dehydratase N-terminal domain-containing protein [Spirillospora sp. NPDC048911]|uniref:FAS1-like dehydratase domain-containing protein n=1 Tax=Spirillospora sp. NPDC048911 TaxID=3364527 RepID=UPI00371010FE
MSDQPTMNPANLGVWSEPFDFKVEREQAIAYAKATNDDHPRYLSGELAPPVFAIVPVFQGMIDPLFKVVPDSLIPFVVHGEQDMVFHRPIVPGQTLVSRAKVTGYASKSSGTTVSLKLETRTDAGELVNEQWMVSFFRGFSAGETVGEHAPGHGLDEALRGDAPVAEVVQHVDDDQTFRCRARTSPRASGTRAPESWPSSPRPAAVTSSSRTAWRRSATERWLSARLACPASPSAGPRTCRPASDGRAG